MRRSILATLLFVFLTFATPASSDQSPQELVRDTSTQILMVLRKEAMSTKQDPGQMHEMIAENVMPHFDLERMGRWTLGKYWRNANMQQREEFINEFRVLLIRSYGSALVDYADAEIDYLPFQLKEGDSRVKVYTKLSRKNDAPVKVTYSLHSTADGWKVYDISVEGISLVANYRSTFMNKIKQDGLDQLIDQLSAKNRQAGGAI